MKLAVDNFKEWNQGCNPKGTALTGSLWKFSSRVF